MAPAPYPNFGWFLRTLRAFPVVAVAALAGGIIGGFSVFAIDLAVTAPPNHGVPPEPGSKLASETADDSDAAAPATKSSMPMRSFDAASAPATAAPSVPARPASDLAAVSTPSLPAVAEPAPVSAGEVSPAQPAPSAMMTSPPSAALDGAIAIVHPQTVASNESQTPPPQVAVTQPRQISWPDALSREHRQISAPPETVEQSAERETTEKTTDKTTPKNLAAERAAAESATKSAPATGTKPFADADANGNAMRRHVATKRPVPPPAPRSGEMAVAHSQSLDHGRPLYDDYGREDGRNVDGSAGGKSRAVKPHYNAHRQTPIDVARSGNRNDDRLYDRSDDRDDDASQDALPPQPPPVLPLFGLFGGGDRDGD